MAGDRKSVDIETGIARRVREVARVELYAVVEDRQDLIVGLRGLVEPAAVNAGIGGDRTENVLWRLEHGLLDNASPKAVVRTAGSGSTKTV